MAVKKILKTFLPAKILYYSVKSAQQQIDKHQRLNYKKKLLSNSPVNKLPYCMNSKYVFENRVKNHSSLCIILAGYKPLLWDTIFDRISKFIPNDVDVCILSSGCYSEKLSSIAKDNDWSYLSTKKNKIPMIQNLAIHLHDNAQNIFKLDEDIFVTNGYFQTLSKTYFHAKSNLLYEVSYIAPIIPVNGYGYIKILDKYNKIDEWESIFGKAVYSDGNHNNNSIFKNPKASKFMWDLCFQKYGSIDKFAKDFKRNEFSYSVCPIRFSIGAIFFERENWLEWGMFPVDFTIGLGLDEEYLAHVCSYHSKVAVVCENAIAFHLGYDAQTEEMMKYFSENKMKFGVLDDEL